MTSRSLTSAPAATWSRTAARLPDCTAWWRSAPGNMPANSRMTAVPDTPGQARELPADVLDFFLNFDTEARADTRFQFLNQGDEIGGGTVPGIVDEIGVIIRDVNITTHDALGPNLLEEPGGRNLALAP